MDDKGVPKYENRETLSHLNMQVVNCSTAASYFHLLRTQMRMPFRKPLIVIAPKKLLKFKGAASPIEDFGEGNRFKLALFDTNPNLVAPEKVRKVIMCSGQVYYDLDDARKKNGDNEVAIIRLESLCPFPFKEIIRELQKYKNASVTWA